MGTDLSTPLALRVIERGGVLESGQIANMRRYRITSDVIHTRLVGEARTLCGLSIRGFEGRFAWQFINRGRFAKSIPSGANGANGCKRCARSPVLAATVEAVEAQRKAWTKL